MIVYQPAFDLYHSIFRFIRILSSLEHDQDIELDRLRIWDFYLLFPNKMKEISFKAHELPIRKEIRTTIITEDNPYEQIANNNVMFERMRPFQLSAIRCIASLGIINKDFFEMEKIVFKAYSKLESYERKLPKFDAREMKTLTILKENFFTISMYGENGLKFKTKLLESKYDA